jgi:hypothetical protein
LNDNIPSFDGIKIASFCGCPARNASQSELCSHSDAGGPVAPILMGPTKARVYSIRNCLLSEFAGIFIKKFRVLKIENLFYSLLAPSFDGAQ